MTMARLIGMYTTIPLYVLCIAFSYPVLGENEPVIQNVTAEGAFGKEAIITCTLTQNSTAEWLFEGKPVVLGPRISQTVTTQPSGRKDDDGTVFNNTVIVLKILSTTEQDAGNYTCSTSSAQQSVILDLSFKASLVRGLDPIYKFNLTSGKQELKLTCTFEVYNQTKVEWILRRAGQNDTELSGTSTRDKTNIKLLTGSYHTMLAASSFDDQNGTYICQVWDSASQKNISSQTDVMLYNTPVLDMQTAVAIKSSAIYFNWTVKTFNSKIKRYHLSVKNNSSDFTLSTKYVIDVGNTSFVMDGLEKNTKYNVLLAVNTEHGTSKQVTFAQDVTTLSEDPVFVPNISINGVTSKSMTIALSKPPPEVAPFVHYYLMETWKRDGSPNKSIHETVRYLPEGNVYMFNNLEPHSKYVFRAKACSDYTKECGNWSEQMNADTLDGTPDRPTAVRVECPAEDGRSYMNLTWQPPAKPNAEIKGYMMELTGNSTYVDRYGVWKTDTWGPLSKFMTNVSRSVRVDDLKPNTKYTVRLSAMTRMRRRGLEEIAYCSTKPAAPDVAPRPRWRKTAEKVGEDIKYTLRVLVPRSSERNGPICCYRVYVVRLLPGLGWSKLPPPQGLPVLTYADAHAPRPELCAYATDVFNNENFPPSELTLGDGRSLSLPPGNGSCTRCYLRPRRDASPDPTTADPTTADPDPDDARRRRGADSSSDLDDEFLRYKRGAESEEVIQVFDGQLDTLSNYSVFVELIPGVDDAEPLYSGYTVALNTANPPVIIASNAMELTLQICCAVAALMLLGTIIFCVVHTRRTRKPRHAHVELNPIQAALRYVVGHIGGRQQLATVPPDMPPIAIEDLAAAYAERQADSDYGFQKEFELLQMLPECYPDRTTHASEARENQPKNRYPDIKAYDQTRVKLTPVDGVPGSDYINANYVMGYKEHKQFICAQGPTDTTVNDFWRMIWEHDLELIVMLTNLEEYSKVKCSKYWPDEIRGSRAFGSVTVHHVSEKRYSDYIVRELRITKQPTNSEGQPIVENGVAKRNGDCKDAESGSAPTSPREAKDASRTVRQYHFLMWKDFAAPEHPQSILRFIKRVNEAWSSLLGRPVVVHCSAGVGRTGTLVALDVLLEQLAATRRASVLAAVAELRRQRNFLVQSLKQYVFVYRALVEYAHYGDTEIPASRLKTSIDRLRNTPAGADKCLMEHEFQKMMNPPVAEPVKSCAAGVTDEARARNRSPDILPYDRNRVILTPAPPAAHCTYINASFIEAYDNTEGYIITQDPLPNTIVDFWRMCSEHNVSTIVMLSELGEGKCPRYWDDGTAQYEHISVQYEESESCPYYTRRQFRVTNNKSGDVSSIRQLQYHGWPTAPGHLPEVTRGLGELGDAARTPAPPPGATTLFHCQYGTERSALFAALCILIAQLRTERRVDVAATARKVRSQRARTIDTFLQYEFLHRAILNYAELHNLLEDS